MPLAVLADPFDHDDVIFELKYDGFRALADVGRGRGRPISRNHHERDGGLYLEIEAIALSRDIPSGLGFLVEPIVRHRAREALMTTLRQTEDAVRNGPASAGGTSKGTASTLHPAR
ncbi:MAG TPA: hypothetical protein VKB88_37695 [Bryobacteraceae bacterium]|nr:hypothetical protein [Bryobacteraceae bacterium]